MRTKNNIVLLLAALTGLALAASCDSKYNQEDYKTLSDNVWAEDSVITFDFTAETVGNYNLYLTLKNGLEYPYRNIYVDYKLYRLDDEEKLITKQLHNFVLFNEVSGVPLGDGSGGWYDHLFPLSSKLVLEEPGTYQIRLQQFMRNKQLPHVGTVGFALEKVPEQ